MIDRVPAATLYFRDAVVLLLLMLEVMVLIICVIRRHDVLRL